MQFDNFKIKKNPQLGILTLLWDAIGLTLIGKDYFMTWICYGHSKTGGIYSMTVV